MLCHEGTILCPQHFVIIFMQIFADDQATFCLVLHFVSRIATVRMNYRRVERRNTTVECSIVTEISKCETILL